MNLSITEIDSPTTIATPKETATPSISTVTYDDILNKLNMHIVDGALQFIRNNQTNRPANTGTNKFQYASNYQSSQLITPLMIPNSSPISSEKTPSPPITGEQYLQMRIQELRRIQQFRQIKSRKIQFHLDTIDTTTSTSAYIQPSSIHPTQPVQLFSLKKLH